MKLLPNDGRFWLYHLRTSFPFAVSQHSGISLNSYLKERDFLFDYDFLDELTGSDYQAGVEHEPWDGFVLDVSINKQVTLALEFHMTETIYFFNEVYLGNTDNNPILSLLKWSELKQIIKNKDNGAFLFWLLLPLAVATRQEEKEIRQILNRALDTFEALVFKENYKTAIVELLLRHLLADNPCFLEHETAGTVCTRPHSFRNMQGVGEEKVIEVNRLIGLATQ